MVPPEAIGHDIERLASRAVPWSAEELVAVLDHLPAMVAFWDAHSCNRYANQAYVEWFGRDPHEMRGMHISELLGPTVYALNLPYIEGALAGRPQLFERTLVDTLGKTRYTQASYTPHIVDGRVDGFFVLVTDITARVEAEEALRRSTETLALLRERERIAADLHDLVIQRLYSTGLQLDMARTEAAPPVRQRIDSALEGIDDAISELRTSINSLTKGMSAGELAPAIDRVIRQATRSLGFAPQLTVSGSLDNVPQAVGPELLAVLTEALSNAARHAAATEVSVRVTVREDGLRLRVADNGRGMANTGRRSGLANMQARADRYRGSFAYRPNVPTGTIMEWCVPIVR